MPNTSFFKDLHYATRVLRRSPGFTVLAMLAMGLGIGINTAVFTAYRAMVARPLDGHNEREMVNIALLGDSGAVNYNFSFPDYEAYRDSIHSYRGLIAANHEQMRLSASDGPVSERESHAQSALERLGLLPSGANNAEFASVMVVSENYFEVLGAHALRGRTFDSMDAPELFASPSVLISENFWKQRFFGEPAILGTTVQLNGASFKIIGITPHDFAGTQIAVPNFWLPLNLEPLVHGDATWLRDRERPCCRVFGRLAPGVRADQAQTELTLAANRLRVLHDPKSDWARPAKGLVFAGSPFPVPLRLNRPLQLTIIFIMIATAMVLAVACANVGSLQLVRARSRQNELETRLALGASRARIIRQLLTESTLLSVLAGTLAFPFSVAMLQFGVAFAAQAFPNDFGTLIFDLTPSPEIFAFVFAISIVAGILFGLAAALESSCVALTPAARGGTATIQTRRIQNWFVAAQVALSLVLMITASILVRSSVNALKSDPGYDRDHVLDVNVQFPVGPNYSAARKLALIRELRTRLSALPGVTAVTNARPPGDYSFSTAPAAIDTVKSSIRNVPPIHYVRIQPNYFRTVGIPMLLGRGFRSQGGPPDRSIILSASAANQLWPGVNPVGHSVRLGAVDERVHDVRSLIPDGPVYEIVGVVKDTRGVELNGSDSRLIYLPMAEDRVQDYPILVRTLSDPLSLNRAIDALSLSVDPNMIETSSTLAELLRLSPSFLISSLGAAVASSVGFLGLLLALIGIYGVVGYMVALRTREIGIRISVGAQDHDILGLILAESMQPVIVGLLAGIVIAIGVSRLLRSLLFGVGTIDGISFIGISILFMAIAVLAVGPQARRAMRLDPTVALRHE